MARSTRGSLGTPREGMSTSEAELSAEERRARREERRQARNSSGWFGRVTSAAASKRNSAAQGSTRTQAPGTSTRQRQTAGTRPNTVAGLLSVPARFMQPRMILTTIVILLTIFGLVMVYSASSVEALSELGDANYYVIRQFGLACVGVLLAAFEYYLGYHRMCGHWFWVFWLLMVALLLFTLALGIAGGGAVRWIRIAGVGFQPSEFAKIILVLGAARCASKYYEEQSVTGLRTLFQLACLVGLPLCLILLQPDKGTTLIMAITFCIMMVFAGVSGKLVVGIVLGILVGGVALGMSDAYSRARILTMFDPWQDPYGSGYQLVQGFIAFGNGGIFGQGIGQSTQKYSFLPEAHNDFIFAIVGEECGLVGTLLVVAGFIGILWAGYKIARHAPDLSGKLVASGCTSVLVVQFLVNVGGILGISPMTGKPLPFLSYGGSSIMSCLMLVGMILAVSGESILPETAHDRARGRISLTTGGGSEHTGFSELPGSTAAPGSARGFTVLTGGAQGGRERINLGPSATERLRNKDQKPHVRRP